MQASILDSKTSEQQFAGLVDELAAGTNGGAELTNLLREEHPIYQQRSTNAVLRMRGWVLLALARIGLPESGLPYVIEELETGIHGYLVAAAARALRSYPTPCDAWAPFVMIAINNIRYRDEPVSFDEYGAYSDSANDTSPIQELLQTLIWLGPHAKRVLAEMESLASPQGGLSQKLTGEVQLAVDWVRAEQESGEHDADACCKWPQNLRQVFAREEGPQPRPKSILKVAFEDQDGCRSLYPELFRGHPTIVVFFYTRCDNPLKCSLTVAKLARIQQLLADNGVAEKIHTAAITYDPEYDHPKRLQQYGKSRNVCTNSQNRMLRTTRGFDTICSHFQLGVNFVGSLVNRHRIEVYIVDAEGRVAVSFERIRWDEQEVVDRAIQLLNETQEQWSPPSAGERGNPGALASSSFGMLTSLAVVFFPKCPICWAAYLSVFSIAGLERIPYAPWLFPVLVLVMLINLGSVWLRGNSTGRMGGFYLAATGVTLIVGAKLFATANLVAVAGVALVVVGSLFGVMSKPIALLSWLVARRRKTALLDGEAK